MEFCDDDLRDLLAVDLNMYFDLVVQAYQQRLFALALQMTRNRQDAEEIAQDTFVRAYRALENLSSDERRILKLRPYLLKIGYRLSLNFIQRVDSHQLQTVSIDLPEGREVLEEMESRSPLPEEEMTSKEFRHELYTYIDQLPDTLRIPVVLHHIIGLPYPEIAGILHQPLNTVKSNGHRGLKKIYALMRKQQAIQEEVK